MVEATHFYGILAVFRGIPFRSVSFRASELALPRNTECIGMSTFFRGITEDVPSLFRGIFSERNSVPNPSPTPSHSLATRIKALRKGPYKS